MSMPGFTREAILGLLVELESRLEKRGVARTFRSLAVPR
ncbi:hypothetical protein FM101_08880 [Arthrobacter rhombi]|uniref:Mobile element protein n=1 Tax=Arthrobacter rhombi TaxID=71253 RepID=A0A1R4GA06_9MICC|nr:hypothetical protein FM101_08880 [Arthrobacter rhombi]